MLQHATRATIYLTNASGASDRLGRMACRRRSTSRRTVARRCCTRLLESSAYSRRRTKSTRFFAQCSAAQAGCGLRRRCGCRSRSMRSSCTALALRKTRTTRTPTMNQSSTPLCRLRAARTHARTLARLHTNPHTHDMLTHHALHDACCMRSPLYVACGRRCMLHAVR
jgi:hypothetical protein